MLRLLQATDLSTVCKLYLDANVFASEESIRDWTVVNHRDYPDLQFVYVSSGVVVGAISGNLVDGVGHIDDLAVRLDYRSHGIGKRLVLAELDAFRKRKIGEVDLWVHIANEQAIPFYQLLGFEITGVEHTDGLKDVPDGERITRMRRSIGDALDVVTAQQNPHRISRRRELPYFNNGEDD